MMYELTIMMILRGWTSLECAIYHGHENVVRVLVELGADIHAKNKELTLFHELTIIMNLRGLTSLHYAIQNGHENVVRTLVELGADIHAKRKKYLNFISTCAINSMS